MANYDESLRSITLNADSTLAVFTGPPGAPGSANANAIMGNQYRAVMVTGVRQAGLANANAAFKVVGILQNKPQSTGNASTIGFSGVSRVITSTNITAGQVVYCDANGKGANVGANVGGGGNVVIGTALDTSTTAGSLVPVLLNLGE